MKPVIKNLLLAFVLLSVGFAVGKEWTARAAKPANAGASPSTTATAGERKVVVSYLHASIRCLTCNSIEKMAHEVVNGEFAEPLRQGRIEWRTANFQKEEALAKHYEVSSATVVVATLQGGKEIGFRRLDDVWKLHRDSAKFDAYVSAAIRAALEEENR